MNKLGWTEKLSKKYGHLTMEEFWLRCEHAEEQVPILTVALAQAKARGEAFEAALHAEHANLVRALAAAQEAIAERDQLRAELAASRGKANTFIKIAEKCAEYLKPPSRRPNSAYVAGLDDLMVMLRSELIHGGSTSTLMQGGK